MSPPFDRYDRGSSRRSVWTHWVPLAVTLAVATAGLAAWVWSQRRDGEDDNAAEQEPGLDYDNADYGDNPPRGATTREGAPEKLPRKDDESYGVAAAPSEAGTSGWGARMSGALRTSSPQHFFDSTGKTVAASVAAASAAVGRALASIREENKAYADNPWSEEADAKKDRASPAPDKRRKTVAVVVSADMPVPEGGGDGSHELASMLSHIPRHSDFSKIKLYMLIYAPGLKESTLDALTSNPPPRSLSSSFSNIGHDQAQAAAEEPKSPPAASSGDDAAFRAVYSQALPLVDKSTMIIPFTTLNGHAHLLRQIEPDIIYLQESLGGDNGSIVTGLQTWLRHDVVLVVGAESGSGGLADSESEAEKSAKGDKWWQRPERVGRGRGVVVVDGMRLHDDWARRVQGRE